MDMKPSLTIPLLIFILLAVMVQSCISDAAPYRFKITNQLNNLGFQVEAPTSTPPAPQPEWGKPSHELSCDQVTSAEQKLILSKRTVDVQDTGPVELCLLGDAFTMVSEDIASEVTEATRVKTVRQTRLARMLQLAQKVKDGTITATERNEALGLLLKDYIRELKELD